MPRIPFANHCNITSAESADGGAEFSVFVEDPLTNSRANAHGGVIMTLLDIAMGHAILAETDDANSFATLELCTSFLRPGEGILRARPRVLRAGHRISFAECEILDENDQIVAKGTGVFKLIRS